MAEICVVTGAGQGIGHAVARRLAAAGHRLVLVGRTAGALEKVAAELPVPTLVVPADIAEPGAADLVFGTVERAWGPAGVVVSAAGGSLAAPLVETTDADWDRMLALNLTAPFRLLRRAAPPMLERGRGRFVVIASVVAKHGESQVAAYAASKHGVLGLVRSAAAELARTGVTVNAVCPGWVDTPMTSATVAAVAGRRGIDEEEARALLARRQPIGRLVSPEEVAAAVHACVENGAINGQGINVDGGAVQS
jgi:NAD(P)-dependent dehydrogenase (short-subunit alcohol dehydrogenase family)